MKKIEVYTDGAVSGNPGGPGGAAAIVIDYLTKETYIEGRFYKETTNQRAELNGIILGLNTILDNHISINDLSFIILQIYSDSAYCMRAFNEGWLEKWQRNGWINSAKKPVANQDLWEEILELKSQLENCGAVLQFIKVKGHSTNKYNNLADEIAVYCKKRQEIYSKVKTFEGENN